MFKRFEIPAVFSLTFFLAIGIFIGFYFQNKIFFYTILPLLLIQLVVFYFRKKIKLYTYIFYGLNALIFINIGFNSIQKQHQSVENEVLKNQVFIEAKVLQVLKPNDFQNRYELETIKINDAKKTFKVIFKPDKRLKLDLKPQSTLKLNARLAELSQNYDFGGFNYTNYLNKKGIKYQLNSPEIISINQANVFYKNLFSFKERLVNFINQSSLSSPSKSIVQALLLGERTTLEDDVKKSFSRTGIIHILAISGLHIGLISVMLLWLLSPLKRHDKTKYLPYILAILSLWIFAIMVGFSSSVVRAVTMFTFINIGLMIKRESSIINTISASMVILLLFNPYFLFDVGFQLSYAAVFAIVLFYPIFKKWYYPKNKIVQFFYDVLLVSLAAQIGVLPLSLFYFHQLPGLFLVANLVAIPLLSVLLILGFIFIILALFSIEWSFFNVVLNFIIDRFILYINFLSGFEKFLWQNIYLSSGRLFILFLIIISFYMYFYSKKFIFLRNTFLLILCFQFVFILEKQFVNTNNHFIFSQKGEDLAVFQFKDKKWQMFSTNHEKFKTEKENLLNSQHLSVMNELPFRNFYNHETNKLLIVDNQNIPIDFFNPNVLIITKGNYYNLDRLILNKSLKEVMLPKPYHYKLRKKIEDKFLKSKIKVIWLDRAIQL